VPRVGSGPGSLIGQFDKIDIAQGYGIKFDQPTKTVQYTGDVYYGDGGLRVDDKAVILEAGEPATYESCTTDTRYTTASDALSHLPPGAAFCVLSSGNVGLVVVKKVPDQNAPSRYYEIALTLWQGPAT
jgi:hypothetical protein